MSRRVVVTGIGVISPLGLDLATTWAGLVAGRSGIAPITAFDASRHDSRMAGEISGLDAVALLGARQARRTDRFVHLAIAATMEAVAQAGVAGSGWEPERAGVLIGSGIGGVASMERGVQANLERGPGRVSPFLVPMMIPDMASGEVSIMLDARATNWAPVSACASSAHAIGEAAAIIRRDEADIMIAGGAEAPVVSTCVAAFANMKALSSRNDEPSRASRPFDRDRDGFVIAEGAAVLVLEDRARALARGAVLLGEIVGYGSTADANHITQPAPGGVGAARAMRLALQQAGLAPEAVDYINAHGTSTPLNDAYETAAMRAVFGDRAGSVAISSTKSMTGHLLGAAGALEAAICLQVMAAGIVPPTINFETPDPACDLDYVPNEARRLPVRVAMTNSFGFGGHNASLVIARAD
ncbi:MAG: beta-ketoacyl-ACP synthase II [Chloroflexi bacterium]|nr:beta-ketoacyl-ACP synthase II [Chloroflexota bacterium]